MRTWTMASLVLASVFAIPCVGDDKAPSAPQVKPAAKASEGTVLAPGMPAPALSIAEWVKGEPVPALEKGKIYVIEFWATWCGPCIASMPHLTELQHEYKDKGVTIIGVSSVDRRGNSLEKVKAMVKEKGDTMGYTVAWDNDRATSDAFMKAARQQGIPCSFVVDKTGTIAYIGHPMHLDTVLEGVVAGTWSSTEGPSKIKQLEKDFEALFQNPNAAERLTKFEALESQAPSMAKMFGAQKFMWQLEAGQTEKAKATGEKLIADAVKQKDAQSLNMFAWQMVDPASELPNKDVDFALRAATEADRLSGGKDPMIIDTLARAYFVKGDKAKAIELQTKAVSLADGRAKEELQKSLDEYKK